MALKLSLKDLGIRRLPKLPATVPVFELATPSFSDRRAGIAYLADYLRLGSLRAVELDHGVIMAGERGEIEYFHASGAVWARDASAELAHKGELREWDGLEKVRSGGDRVRLKAEASRALIAQARAVLETTGLIGREAVAGVTVALDQVAQLDAKGSEHAFGAGSATVKVSYAVEGIAVAGAGAKSLVFADPGRKQARVTGAFHCWRPFGSARPVKVPSIEEALGVGVLTDPELVRYGRAGHAIRIARLDFVYLALPAFVRQSHLFPAFRIEGSVSKGELGEAFDFARYHHAVPPRNYAAADLFGPYLAVNPDGIAPAAPAERAQAR
jgi:hypothetical protein